MKPESYVMSKKRKQQSTISYKADLILLSVLSVFTFLLYAHTLHYPFNFDDEITITQNPNLHLTELSWIIVSNMFRFVYGLRPISTATFALNYYWGGLDVFGYHLVNVIIHILNGILIYLLVKKTLTVLQENGQGGTITDHGLPHLLYIPFFSSLIWLAHPLQTNSVTYIVQRMNSLACLFFLLSMILYIQGRKHKIQAASISNQTTYTSHLLFGGSFISGLLALGCKEIAVTLPFYILLYELFFFQGLRKKAITFFFGGTIIVTLLSILLFQLIIGFGYLKSYFATYYAGFPFTMYQRVLTEFRVVVHYISLFFFPHPDRLNFDYDFTISQSFTDPITTLLSAGILIGLVLFAIAVSKKERLLSFGILWFIGNLAIESSIIPVDLIFEHRTYLPSVYLSVIVLTLLWRFITADRFKMGLYLLITVLLAYWTIERNNIWSSPIVFWQDCVKKSPHKDRTHANLGKALAAEGLWDEAIAAYQKALQLNLYHQFALRNMGLAFYHKGKLDEAIDYYRRALQSDPELADAHNDLGVALIDKKQLEEGIFHYREALRLQPNHPDAPANLRRAVEGLEKFNRQISITLDRLKTEPQNIEYLSRLGRLYFLKGNFREAMDYYHQALYLDGRHLPALQGKAAVQMVTKEYDSAIETFKQMLRIQPDDNRIYYNIACAYSLRNNKSQALHWLRKAVINGFTKREVMEQDKDLSNIRNTKEYQYIISSIPR